ncbi:hypothetical protein [Streptomyces sp. NPDC002328]|uniref:hypothetical protein n=1 Tax=Streptomyces sp. NPDC002328 TaxID=3364642 RepID=UPI0036BA6CB6
MTPWRRGLYAAGAALLALGGPLYGGGAAHAADPPYGSVPYAAASASASPSASPSDPDRAGSRAGEGRARPGRSREATTDGDGDGYVGEDEEAGEEAGEEPGEDVSEDPDGGIEPPREAGFVPSATPQAAPAEEQPVGRMLRILPLGSGLLLIGLGCGLAFFGLRLRRG